MIRCIPRNLAILSQGIRLPRSQISCHRQSTTDCHLGRLSLRRSEWLCKPLLRQCNVSA